MGNLADYFDRVTYKAKYHIGDRIFGRWNKIPFVGSVGNDSCPDGVNARVSVHLDLPVKYKDKVYTIIFVEHKDIKSYLISHEEHLPRNSGSERKTKGKVDQSTNLQVLPIAKLEVARKTKRSQKTNKGV